jgi:hypothetical protein
MKMPVVILALAAMVMAMAVIVRAQDVRSAFVAHPHITGGDLTASRFWTPSRIALVALDAAAKAADSLATRENLDAGGYEHDPLARPFVHNTAVQVAATAALFGGEVATSYLLHKRHHDRMGLAILLGGAVVNGLGAASSFDHRYVKP